MDNTTPVAKDINENDSPTTTTAVNNSNNHDDIGFSDWCGWHNDHGSLTGLVPAMFLDVNGMEIICPDKQAGLYVKARNGRTVHVVMPPGSLGFQIGEVRNKRNIVLYLRTVYTSLAGRDKWSFCVNDRSPTVQKQYIFSCLHC